MFYQKCNKPYSKALQDLFTACLLLVNRSLFIIFWGYLIAVSASLKQFSAFNVFCFIQMD